MLTLDEMKAIPLLTLSEAGRGLTRNVPPVEEVERRVGHRAEQRVPVPHHRPIFEPPLRVHLAVVHDHDHREAGRRALVRERDCEKVG